MRQLLGQRQALPTLRDLGDPEGTLKYPLRRRLGYAITFLSTLSERNVKG
jgi:hypothetical protein